MTVLSILGISGDSIIMQLYSLLIEGFRKHLKTKILFSDSTFLKGIKNEWYYIINSLSTC